ncbi:Kinesin-like protein kif21b [Gaertneriomyces sp. JEL0708]|nr:Kinesin-like protein kif21b [Gaertneriomyces sp. JEL0708]
MGTGLDTAEPEDHGLVPRAIYYLFDRLRDQALSNPEGFKYEVYVSFLELYNEEIVDLLNPKPKDTTGWGGLSIREDAGKIVWHGVKDIPVSSPEELLTLLEKGSLCRTTGSTDMNAASSRSHAIFSVTLKQQKWTASPQNDTSKPNTPTPSETPTPSVRDDDSRPETPATHPDGSYQNLVSKFHFVDLAGSERLKRTNAEGDRKKEGISINQGLLALGNVISALGDDTRKGAHVPYRDSKLTRMLQDSLGGNSQTLMLACVSPSDTNYGETMNTLNYANRARNIKNKVVINQEWAGGSAAHTAAMEREIRILRATVAQMKAQLCEGDSGTGFATPSSYRGGGEYLVDQRLLVSGALKDREIQMRLQRERDLEDELGEVTREKEALRLENERLRFRCFRLQDRCRDLGRELADTIIERDRAVIERSRIMSSSASSKKRKADTVMETGSASGVKIRKVWGEEENRKQSHKRDSPRSRPRSSASDGPDSTSTLDLTQGQQPQPSSSKSSPSSSPPQTPLMSPRPSRPSSPIESHAIIKQYVRTISDLRYRLTEVEDKLEWYNDVVAKLGGKGRNGRSVLAPSRRGDEGLWTKEEIGLEKDMDEEFGIPARPIVKQLSQVEREESSGEEVHERRLHSALKENPQLEEVLGEIKTLPKEDTAKNDVRIIGIPRSNSIVWEPSSLRLDESADAGSVRGTAGGEPGEPPDDDSSDMFSLINKIQADIAEHEKLVSRIQHRDAEYETMKHAYEAKLDNLQSQLMRSKQERDQALKRMQDGGKKEEKKGSIAIKQHFEEKKKQLERQIEEYRRKSADLAKARDERRGHDEALMKGLKNTIAVMKGEKTRMLRELKKEREKSRALEMSTQREIANLRRKERKANELAKRLEEKSRYLQRAMRQQQRPELMNNRRTVMTILKRTTTPSRISKGPSGSMSPKRRSGTAWKVTTNPDSVRRPGSARGAVRRISKLPKSGEGDIDGDDVDALPFNVKAQFKKQMLDKELAACVECRQAQKTLDDLKVIRTRLLGEQQELVAERERCVRADEAATGVYDPEKPQYMDERLAVLDDEIAMVNVKIDRAAQVLKRARLGDSEREEEQVASGLSSPSSPSSSHLNVNATDNSWENAMNLLRSLDPYELEAVAELCLEDLIEWRCKAEGVSAKLVEREKAVSQLRKALERHREIARRATAETDRKVEEARFDERRRLGAVDDSQPTPESIPEHSPTRYLNAPLEPFPSQHRSPPKVVDFHSTDGSPNSDDRGKPPRIDAAWVAKRTSNIADEHSDMEMDDEITRVAAPSPTRSDERPHPQPAPAAQQRLEEKPEDPAPPANLTLRERMKRFLRVVPAGPELAKTLAVTNEPARKPAGAPSTTTDEMKENRNMPSTPPRGRQRSSSTSSRSASVEQTLHVPLSQRRSPSWTYGRDSPRTSVTTRSPSLSPKKRDYLNGGASPGRLSKPSPLDDDALHHSASTGSFSKHVAHHSPGSSNPNRNLSGADVFERLATSHTVASQSKVVGAEGARVKKKASDIKGDE